MTLLRDDLTDLARNVRQLTEFIRKCRIADVPAAHHAALGGLVNELEVLLQSHQALSNPSSESVPPS